MMLGSSLGGVFHDSIASRLSPHSSSSFKYPQTDLFPSDVRQMGRAIDEHDLVRQMDLTSESERLPTGGPCDSMSGSAPPRCSS
jgi:hypothetical protein